MSSINRDNDDYIYRCPDCKSTEVTVYHSTITGFSHKDGRKIKETIVDVNECSHIICDTCDYKTDIRLGFKLWHDYDTEISEEEPHYTMNWIGTYQPPGECLVVERFDVGLNEDPLPVMLELLKDETLEGQRLKLEDFTITPHNGDQLKVLHYRWCDDKVFL